MMTIGHDDEEEGEEEEEEDESRWSRMTRVRGDVPDRSFFGRPCVPNEVA